MTLRSHGAEGWAIAEAHLAPLPIDFYPVGRALAEIAAQFKARNRMSLADAFAAALATQLGATLITGDPEFKALENEIPIAWLPQRRRK